MTSVTYDLFGRRTAINSSDAGLTTVTYDLAPKQTANLKATAQRWSFNLALQPVRQIETPSAWATSNPAPATPAPLNIGF